MSFRDDCNLISDDLRTPLHVCVELIDRLGFCANKFKGWLNICFWSMITAQFWFGQIVSFARKYGKFSKLFLFIFKLNVYFWCTQIFNLYVVVLKRLLTFFLKGFGRSHFQYFILQQSFLLYKSNKRCRMTQSFIPPLHNIVAWLPFQSWATKVAIRQLG